MSQAFKYAKFHLNSYPHPSIVTHRSSPIGNPKNFVSYSLAYILLLKRFTKPGGWVEFQDFDMKFYTTNGEFTPGCPLDQWTDSVIEGIKKINLEPEPGPKLEGWVRDAGFENIHHRLLPIPVGQWPKDKKLVLATFLFPTTFDCPEWAYSKHLTHTDRLRLRKRLVPST